MKRVVFDLDGTLLDTAQTIADVMNSMLGDRGVGRRVAPTDARQLVSSGADQLVAGLLGGALRDPVADLAEFRTRYAATPTPPHHMFHGVMPGLQALAKAGLRLSVCTNKPQALAEQVLCEVGISKLFDVIVGGGILPAKPQPAMLEAALAGAQPQHAVLVGDSSVDESTAAAANVRFVFASWGYAEAGWTPSPHHLRPANMAEATALLLALPN